MAFEGDLSNLSLGDVLQTIAMSRQVGTFVIRGEEERRLACGPQGVALLSSRTSLGLRIGAVLLGTEKITKEQLDHALKVQRRRRDTPLGAILVESGACDEDALRQARRYLAAEEIFDLFVWKEGKFEFLAGEPEATGPFADLWFDVGSLAMEAARRIDELPRAMEAVPEGEVFRASEGANDKRASLQKNADLSRLYGLIDGTRSVADIQDEFYRGRFDTLKGLETLLEWKLIRPAELNEILDAGRDAMASRDHTRASRLFRRAAAHAPMDDSIHVLVAEALRESGEKRLAAAELVAVGLARLEAGKELPAVEALRQALSLDPTSADAHEGLMNALAQSGQADEAVESARSAASARIALGDYAAAVRVAEAGLAQCPGDPALMTSLANANQGLGRSSEAVRLLDDVAQILEGTSESDRKLLDVYRRIRQIDPSRKDCQRRIDEIAAADRSRRRKVMQRVAIAAGALVLAMAAVPFLRGPSSTEIIGNARRLVDERKADEALAVLATLGTRSLDEDESIEKRGLEARIEELKHPPEGAAIRESLEKKIEDIYSRASKAVSEELVADGLSSLDDCLDVLDGPAALKYRASDSGGYEKMRADAAGEVLNAIGQAATVSQKVASRVTSVRDRFVEDVWKREDLDVLRDLVQASSQVVSTVKADQWASVPGLVQKLVGRTRAPRDGTDKKTIEAVTTIVDAYGQVREYHDRALARARRKELKEGYKSAYGNGTQLERDGKLEEALSHYDKFLAQCEDLRKDAPEKLYAPIIKELFTGEMQLDQRIKTSRDRLAGVLHDCEESQKAEAADDFETAFRIRRRVVLEHPDIDMTRRFQMPLRIETAPPGAEVFLVDGSPGGRALGRTPVATQYPVTGGTKFQVRLAGYKSIDIYRKGAADDASGVERVELPKLAAWSSRPAGTTEAAPTIADGAIITCGRNGTVRRLDARSGAEIPAFAPAGLIDGFAGSAVVHDGVIFAASLDGRGFILELATLQKLATFDTGPVRGSPVATSRGVVVADEKGAVRLVESSGRIAWTKTYGRVKSDLAASGDHVVAVTADAELLVLDGSTGSVVARKSLRADTLWAPPSVRGGRIFLGNEAGDVVCLDAASLQEAWTHHIDGPVRNHLAVSDLRIVACTASGAVHLIDAETGNVLNKTLVGGKVDDGLLGLADGGFVVVTRKGNAIRFDAKGQVVWRFDAGEDVSAAPRMAGDLMILVTRKGTVIALAQ